MLVSGPMHNQKPDLELLASVYLCYVWSLANYIMAKPTDLCRISYHGLAVCMMRPQALVMLICHTTLAQVHACPYPANYIYIATGCYYYPAQMRRGKVISRVFVVVMDTKITKSGDVRTWASCKHNEYVEFGEKLASVCSESSGTACESHKSCILVGHRSHTHRHYPLCIMHVLSAHVHNSRLASYV